MINKMQKIIIFILLATTWSCSFADHEYLCFSDPKIINEKLCYITGTNPDMDETAMGAVKQFFSNIENSSELIKLEGKMSSHYSPENFQKGLVKHYSGMSEESVLYLLTKENVTVILLKNNSTLFYGHESSAFIFSYETPLAFKGAINFFGKGHSPEKVSLKFNDSNCNLIKDGVIYLSPPKQSFLYDEAQSFCEYNGRFFVKANDKISIKRIDQIGQGYSVLHGDFYKFLLWLQRKS